MISLRRVGKRYADGSEALREVDLQIAGGEMVVLLGPSGAGKSTLLRLMGGIERASSGTVEIFGQNPAQLDAGRLALVRQQIGLIFEDFKLLHDRNALQNVLVPLEIAGYRGAEARKRARAALEKVGLGDRESARPDNLSGGEQQRLCIARAVVSRPALILADEPSGNLDAAQAAAIADMLKAFNAIGTTVVVATHDPLFRDRLAGRAVKVEAGRAYTVGSGGKGWVT
ncbi:MAG: ATP-binding cassette domain-containing protein [Rhodocyclaceae bacterium]|nr:ATP-binding cassette domain-containing protein [Rhodocyclaceae bacterium]